MSQSISSFDSNRVARRLSDSKYMVPYDGLTVETTITHNPITVHQWIESISTSTYGRNSRPRVVGLDTEWMHMHPQKIMKVAILQLCIENKCLIIQLFCMNNNVPKSLRSFFMDSNFEFVGVGVMNDLKMLKNDYGLECNKGIDLSLLANEKWPDRFSSSSHGLKYLAKKVALLDMEKPKHVCMSKWNSKELTLPQVEYACIDAYASFKIGEIILSEK